MVLLQVDLHFLIRIYLVKFMIHLLCEVGIRSNLVTPIGFPNTQNANNMLNIWVIVIYIEL